MKKSFTRQYVFILIYCSIAFYLICSFQHLLQASTDLNALALWPSGDQKSANGLLEENKIMVRRFGFKSGSPSPLPRLRANIEKHIEKAALYCHYRFIWTRCLGAIFAILFAVAEVRAHEDHDHGHDAFNLEATLRLYQRVAELTPLIAVGDNKAPLSYAKMKYRGEELYLNSHFWELVSGWLEIYRAELERDCVRCDFPDHDFLLEEAKDHVARGALSLRVTDPLRHATEHIVIGTADIGARLGTAALVAKAASEVAETVGSKFIGGAGVHILCNLIDAVIIFGTRHIQTWWRVPQHASDFNHSGVAHLLRQAWIQRGVWRAQQRVQFVLGPVSIDDHELHEVDEEGPQRWWGYIEEGKRHAWVTQLVRKSQRLDEQIQELRLQTENETSPKGLKSIQKKISQLESKKARLGQISAKDFRAARYKRFLFLKARTHGNPHHLAGTSLMDRNLSQGPLWVLSVQSNVLNRSLLRNPQSPDWPHWINKLEAQKRLIEPDDTREGLAAEFVRRLGGTPGRIFDAHKESVSKALLDVDNIFNPDLSRAERYLQVLILESTLTGLMYKLMQKQLDETYSADPTKSWLSNMTEASTLHWRLGRFASVVYEFSDYLRAAAYSTNASELYARKHLAQDFLLETLYHLSQSSKALSEGGASTEFIADLKTKNKLLMTKRPWKEKRTKYSLLPFFKPSYPRCEDLAQRGDH